MPRKRKRKKATLYLGWDGAYVLSQYKLRKFRDGACEYLATGSKLGCTDIHEWEGRHIFGHLKLKKYEVIKIEIGEAK